MIRLSRAAPFAARRGIRVLHSESFTSDSSAQADADFPNGWVREAAPAQGQELRGLGRPSKLGDRNSRAGAGAPRLPCARSDASVSAAGNLGRTKGNAVRR